MGGLLVALAGSAWARTALRYGVTALAILLFLLDLRRAGKRAALGLVTIWLNGCATVSSDGGAMRACPPVVAYSKEIQARAAEGSAIAEMMVDYAVMREQSRIGE